MQFDFDIIRPYSDEEIHPAMLRIAESKEFSAAMNWLFPDLSEQELKNKVASINSTYEFQKELMYHSIRKILEKTGEGLTSSGFDQIDPKKSYIYIANHRDIFLDSGILQVLFFDYNIPASQITFGSNLMKGMLVDVGKVNKMFTVFRGGDKREIYTNAMRLSAYIRHVITKVNDSVWIAQRGGRTKNGLDQTQTSVLKMFSLSGSKDFVACFDQINLAPTVISYEYEPCDYLKAQELHLTAVNGAYQKDKTEDLNSILAGIRDYKGRVHLAIAKPIEKVELEKIDAANPQINDKIKALCDLVDQRIYSTYKLWPTNYIAFDLAHGNGEYEDHYTAEEKDRFITIMNERLANCKGDSKELKALFLKIYANPVEAFIKNSSIAVEKNQIVN